MARRIGVEVTTETRGGPTNPGGPAGQFHIVGVTERGPVGQIVTVRSLAEFTRRLGGRTPYSGAAYDAARLFFNEGGSQLLVSRVVGSGAKRAGVDLLAPGDGDEGSGDPVARVEVAEFGGFANGGTVEVQRAQDTYSVIVTDHTGEVIASVRNVDTLDRLVAGARSNPYVNITSMTEQDELSLATDNYDLSGGSDDRENVSTDDVLAALDAGGDDGEGGAVAAPGYPADVIGAGLIEHASRHRKIALLAGNETDSLSDVEAIARTLHEETRGEYGALFHPHVQVTDSSGARVVSPEAFVAAARARMFATGAFWSSPAGTVYGRARWATATVPALSRADIERLDESYVNGIETSGSRVYLNNWTSLAVDRENLELLRDADVLNNLAVQIERTLEQYVWEDIDSRGLLHSDIDSAVTAIVSEMAANGGTWADTNDDGEELDPGYVVSVNPDPGLAAQNRVEVEVGVRLPGAAKLISVGLIKVAIGGDL